MSNAVNYKTYSDISSICVVSDEDSLTGLLVEPMDTAPFVIQVGNVDMLKHLGAYITQAAEQLESQSA